MSMATATARRTPIGRRRDAATGAARPALGLAGHRGQGVRRPPPERPVPRPAGRARAGRRRSRCTSPPTRSAPWPRRRPAVPADLPGPVHGRFAGRRHPARRRLRRARGAAARARLRVRRRQRRASRGHAAAAARPADLSRRRHQRQVRGRDGGHRARPGEHRHAHRRRSGSSASASCRTARRSCASSPGSAPRSCTSALWLAFGLLLSVLIRRAATAALVGFGVWCSCRSSATSSRRSLSGLCPAEHRRSFDDAVGGRPDPAVRRPPLAQQAVQRDHPGHPQPDRSTPRT